MPADHCKFCGALCSVNRFPLKGIETHICDDCMYEITRSLPELTRKKQFDYACEALAWHFAGIPWDQLVATSRQFPGHMRADVQTAIDRLFSASPIRFFGIHEQHRYETLNIAALIRDGRDAQATAPAQYHDVDVGESAPVKCLTNGLWLCRTDDLCYAVVLSSHREYGHEAGTRIEIAVPDHYKAGEYKDCAVDALNALESTMKVICDLKGWSYAQGARSSDLLKVLRREELFPEFADQSFDQLVATLKSGLPTLRNETGGHWSGCDAGCGAELRRVLRLEPGRV
jgi:hypothetical protein